MTQLTYHVVEHDGGWAYKVGDVFSETFATHDAAERAAEEAAARHEQTGEPETISYQQADGSWREETEPGDARPDTDVDG